MFYLMPTPLQMSDKWIAIGTIYGRVLIFDAKQELRFELEQGTLTF